MNNNTDNEVARKLIIEVPSKISQTCRTELFFKIINAWYPLTFSKKASFQMFNTALKPSLDFV